jgi:hypothetical protein
MSEKALLVLNHRLNILYGCRLEGRWVRQYCDLSAGTSTC